MKSFSDTLSAGKSLAEGVFWVVGVLGESTRNVVNSGVLWDSLWRSTKNVTRERFLWDSWWTCKTMGADLKNGAKLH